MVEHTETLGAVPANGRRIPSQRQIVLHVVESAPRTLMLMPFFRGLVQKTITSVWPPCTGL